VGVDKVVPLVRSAAGIRNYLTNRGVLRDDVEAVLREDDEAAIQLAHRLDGGRVLALGLDQVLDVVLDANAALLGLAVRPIVEEDGAVITNRNLGSTLENIGRRNVGCRSGHSCCLVN